LRMMEESVNEQPFMTRLIKATQLVHVLVSGCLIFHSHKIGLCMHVLTITQS